MVLEFAFDDGLTTRDGEAIRGFGLRDAAGGWYWADARLSGNSIIVSSPEVKVPDGICYNWADNPVGNLVNGAGLPADAFRADL